MCIFYSALERPETNYKVTFSYKFQPFKSFVNDNYTIFIHILWDNPILLSSA